MNVKLKLDRAALEAFCRRWGIQEIALFGSALRDDFRADSDLDFLVSFAPDISLDVDRYLDMKQELEKLSGRRVDLVEKDTLRNPWKKYEILRTREIIYAA